MNYSNFGVFSLFASVTSFTIGYKVVELRQLLFSLTLFFILLFFAEILANIRDSILEEMRKIKNV